ncbi:hypothetical protein MRX96_029498 [Rhipicephalus microplus]
MVGIVDVGDGAVGGDGKVNGGKVAIVAVLVVLVAILVLLLLFDSSMYARREGEEPPLSTTTTKTTPTPIKRPVSFIFCTVGAFSESSTVVYDSMLCDYFVYTHVLPYKGEILSYDSDLSWEQFKKRATAYRDQLNYFGYPNVAANSSSVKLQHLRVQLRRRGPHISEERAGRSLLEGHQDVQRPRLADRRHGLLRSTRRQLGLSFQHHPIPCERELALVAGVWKHSPRISDFNLFC